MNERKKNETKKGEAWKAVSPSLVQNRGFQVKAAQCHPTINFEGRVFLALFLPPFPLRAAKADSQLAGHAGFCRAQYSAVGVCAETWGVALPSHP